MSARHLVVISAFLLFARVARAEDPAPEAHPAEAAAAAPAPAAAADAPATEPGDGDAAADEPADPAADAEFAATFKDVPTEVSETDLQARPPGQQLAPSLSPEQLRALAKAAKAKVLARIEHKIEAKSAKRMGTISACIQWFSLAGLLLLLMPLVLRRKYPGQGKNLVKYSALAALTFVVTVNLFGAVVLGFRSAQAAIGSATNPQLHVVSGFFDTLDKNADDYVLMGKELFAPTLAQLQSDSDEQPVAVLLENGKKLIKDADVFVTIAKTFKKLDVVFGILPTVLLLVTMVLFVLAIRPTLMSIIRLPIDAAAGKAPSGRHVVTGALRRVGGEMLATLCTLVVLVGLTFLAGAILARVVGPALEALIGYFSLGVMYLQFQPNASTALVFLMLFSVILFLVLNLAAVIASMTLFLGKAQKIFQRRFNEGERLATHARFWKWGIASLLVAQVVPWLYLLVAERAIEKLDDKLMAGVTEPSQIPWTAILLLGPVILVVGFLLVFWAARGFKALAFIAKYKPAAEATRS